MALFSLAALTTPATREEVEEKIYEVIGLVGGTTTSWKPGAVMRTMITGSSIILAALSTLIAQIARSGFLELATGAWLDLVAWYVYGVEREAATFAEGTVTLSNAGGGVYLLDPGDLTLLNPTTGKQYRNSGAVTIPALAASVAVPIVAVEAGAASTAAPGMVTELVTPLLGVSCTNAAPVVGLDAEADSELRARCSEKLGSLSPFGPWDAYSYACRTARRADGSLVGVKRVRTRKDGAGNVTTYVATASGGVSGSVATPGSDLAVVDEAVQRFAAPLAVTAFTASAVEVPISVQYRVEMYNTSGRTQAQIASLIRDRLVAFMRAQPIGGHIVGDASGVLYHDAIRTAIGSTLPQIFHVEVLAPAGDVALGVSSVPVLASVTPQLITQVPPSEGAVP